MTADLSPDTAERLAETLNAHQATRGMKVSMGYTCACGWWSPDQSPALIRAHQTEALLPVVAQLVAEKAVAELERMADLLAKDHQVGPARRCRNRAAAIRQGKP